MKFAGSIRQTCRLFVLGLVVFGVALMSVAVSPLYGQVVKRNQISISSDWRFHLGYPVDVISDGSTLITGSLPAAARQGLEVAFAPKTVHWLKFIITGVKANTQNIDHADWAETQLVVLRGILKLTKLKWQSATCGWGNVSVGRSAAGTPLMIDGQQVADGNGTHAPSLIVYNLPPGYNRFQARAGLDNSGTRQAIGGATVNFMVFTHRPPSLENKPVRVALADLGFTGPCEVRDLWQHQNLGVVGDLFESTLPENGAGLYLVNPQPVKTLR